MKIVVDESVSDSVALFLRNQGYDVLAIAEGNTSGSEDYEVFNLVRRHKAILITRDHHFTNNLRFPPEETAFIIFIRKGNLTSQQEIDLIDWFFSSYSLEQCRGKLITLSSDRVKVR